MANSEECSSALEIRNVGLPQQLSPLSNIKDQAELDPDRGDFLEPSVPTESACSDINLTFSDLPDNFSQIPSLQPPSQQEPPSSWSVTRDILNHQTQQLIDDINSKRKRDSTILNDFKKAIELQVSTSCDNMEQAMYQMYESNGKVIQDKLQELFATLDRISKLEMELDQFKNSLGMLYSEIQGQSTRQT